MRSCLVVSALMFAISSSLFSQETPRVYGEDYHAFHVGGGYFAPATGQGGIQLHLGGTIERSPRLLLGGELAYQSYKTTIFHTDNVDMTGIMLTTTLRYVFEAEAAAPMIGAYLGYGFHVIDETDIPWVTFERSTAQSYGIGAMAGVLLPLSERTHLLFEGRYGGDWLRTEIQGVMSETRNVGGLTVLAELLFQF